MEFRNFGFILLFALMFSGCSSCSKSERLYAESDFDSTLGGTGMEVYQPKNPGRVCWPNDESLDCFQLLVIDNSKMQLVFENSESKKRELIEEFETFRNDIFLDKTIPETFVRAKERADGPANIDPTKPAVVLVYWGKMDILFYRDDNLFKKIWLTD